MKKQLLFFYISVVLFVFCSFTFIDKSKTISNFNLKSATTNKWVSLSDYEDSKGFIVVFICNKCPMAKFYSQRMNQMEAKYKKMGVPLVAINSMDTLAYGDESFKQMQKKVLKEQLHFPYLQDKKQQVAKQFNATHTPQAFVIWKTKGKFIVNYEGAIDDNAGEPEKAQHHFLTDAVEQLLQGKKVTVTKSESFGCRIFYRGNKSKMN